MKITSLLTAVVLCGTFSISNLNAGCGDAGCSKDAGCPKEATKCSADAKACSKAEKKECSPASMIKKFDVNGTRNLDASELIAMANWCHDQQLACQAKNSKASPKSTQLTQTEPFDAKRCVAEVLVKFDKNGNGALSQSELKTAMENCAKSKGSCKKDASNCSDDKKDCSKGSCSK